ncbi:protein unc-13 homolog [Hibiscus syriacus]|uniref:protein unc-13 homolog n=1 Tax=Hibiscus syriacus TaxID=106335 RepID=UPI00192369E5|nr:protein unc-13 homolog [Hibiscus syriacus]
MVQMVVEDFEECVNGGKVIIKEMIPYEVDTVTLRLLGLWINERLNKGRKLVHNAKKTETWSPISKSDRYAYSAAELMNLTKETVNEFFQIPVGITEDLILDLAEGLEQVIQEYVTFLASCGSKQNYLPTLPPLTRCNKDSMLSRLWKRASPCGVRDEEMHQTMAMQCQNPSPSTSLGTQCLYIRLNTLNYLISHIHALDKTLALSPRVLTRNRNQQQYATPFSYFERANGSIQAACDHVSETAAYRLIFLDTNLVFYESLYIGGVASSRIRPVIRILKQNLMLLTNILTNQTQALAIKEITKASFEAFLMVLLAGVPSRNFNRSDYEMIEEDFQSLKRIFYTFGEGSLSKNVVQQEAEKAKGVISLMGQTTEQLIEDFSIVTCDTNGIGFTGIGQKLPMPPKTGSWNRSDPNTILRVLCHRNDRMANHFLKKSVCVDNIGVFFIELIVVLGFVLKMLLELEAGDGIGVSESKCTMMI